MVQWPGSRFVSGPREPSWFGMPSKGAAGWMCRENWNRRPETENRVKSLASPQPDFGWGDARDATTHRHWGLLDWLVSTRPTVLVYECVKTKPVTVEYRTLLFQDGRSSFLPQQCTSSLGWGEGRVLPLPGLNHGQVIVTYLFKVSPSEYWGNSIETSTELYLIYSFLKSDTDIYVAFPTIN